MKADAEWDILTELIEHTRAQNAEFSIFDQFSNFFKSRFKYLQAEDKTGKTLLVRIERVVEKFFFISLVVKRKIDALLAMLVISVSHKNLITISQLARALLEHAATLAHLSDQLEKLHNQLQNQSDLKTVEAATRRAEQFVARAYHGKSPKLEPNKENQAIHINDAIKSLQLWLEDAGGYYDFLTEYVHPNSGSNSLISISGAEDILLSIIGDIQRPDAKQIAKIIQELLKSLSAIELRIYANTASIGLTINRAVEHKLKTENMFVTRQLDVIGDGLSKERPLQVPKARDAHESMQTIMKYFQKRGYDIYSQMIGEIKGSPDHVEVIDIYETSKGRRWVLIRHKT